MTVCLNKDEIYLKYSSCGFKFFVGDIVLINPIKRPGYIQWIDLKEKIISVNVYTGYMFIDFNKKQFTLKKTGERITDHGLFPKDRLLRLYNTLTDQGKVFFLYHYYDCSKEKIEKIIKKLNITKDQIKSILLDFKKRGYL